MSLRWRFALIFAGGAILATLVAAGAAVVTTGRAVYRGVDQFLVERSHAVDQISAHMIRQAFDDLPAVIPTSGRAPGGTRRLPAFVTPDSIMQWNDLDGTLLARLEDTAELPAVSAARDGTIDNVRVGDRSYRRIVSAGPDAVVQVARDVTPELAVLAAVRRRIIGVGLVLTFIAAAGGWLIARRMVEPIERLTGAAEEVARTRRLLQPIDASAEGEVGRLATAFNTMLAALAESRAQQQRLVQDAGHELRTPLTSLRTNIEVLQRVDGMPDEHRARLLADVDLELRELSDLVTELIALATDTSAPAPTAPADLGDLARAVAERSRRRFDHPITVSGRGATLELQASDLERAITNLVENAAKWSDPDRPIEVIVDGGSLSVRDHGPGIAEEDLPHVFDRFYRATEARAKPGSGLGLSIVEQIIRRHGGTVRAANARGGGAIVGFDLPVPAQAAE